MNTSDLKQSLRHLKKDKLNTLINISGLTLGLSIVAVITVFLINELGYNSTVEKRGHIYRVLNFDKATQKLQSCTPYVLGEYVKEHIAGVEKNIHYSVASVKIKKGTEFIQEDGMVCTEGDFFDMFNVKLLQGKISPDFNETDNKIYISQSVAKKYFSATDVVGKELTINLGKNEKVMQVAGVYKDIPENTSLKPSMVGGMKLDYQLTEQNIVTTGLDFDFKTMYYSWQGGQLSSNYLLLKPGADIKNIEKQLADIGKKNSDEHTQLSFSLQPLTDIYFGSNEIMDNTNLEKGNLNMVYILAVVGFLILIIACINYLNLSSAQAFIRSKGLSVNRVFGAKHHSLIMQMVAEAVIVALIALPIAIFLAYLFLPYLNEFLGHAYPLKLTHRMGLALLSLFLITLGIGALSGWLVSLKITSFNVVDAIKGKNMLVGNKFPLRKAMLTFQFAVFIMLLIVVIGVKKQVQYVMNANMGFQKEGILRIKKGDKNYQIYKQEILKNPNVVSVSAALWMPPSNNAMDMSMKPKHLDKPVLLRGNMVDYDFAKTMGIKIIEGQDFQKEKHQSGVLLSESAVKLLDIKDGVIGKPVGFGNVVGVISDFSMSSLHDKTNPMILILQPASCQDIAVKINTASALQTITFLEKEWKKLEGTSPFAYNFIDDILAEMYQSDTHFAQIISILALFAILIAGMGLFGLSVLMSRQKTKEIGIRKVNGATIGEIMSMFNAEYVKWVAVAFVVASPLAYWAINRWLQNFVMKTQISWWIFALAGLIALAITLLTVSWQSWHAATRNPVEALRYE